MIERIHEFVARWLRQMRFYYKPDSRALYREQLPRQYWTCLLFPFTGHGIFRFSDFTIQIPYRFFDMLATMCRISKLDAKIEWDGNTIVAHFSGFTFLSPGDNKLLYSSLQYMVLNNSWRLPETPNGTQLVIDVGSHIGQFAVMAAKRGFHVHAIEPFSAFCQYISRNAEANGVADRIHIHSVGLSNRSSLITNKAVLREAAHCVHGLSDSILDESIQMVDASEYMRPFLKHQSVALLKSNCEGGEYDFFKDNKFLRLANPERISMEFHRGAASLQSLFEQNGYHVEAPNKDSETYKTGKGLLFAIRQDLGSRHISAI